MSLKAAYCVRIFKVVNLFKVGQFGKFELGTESNPMNKAGFQTEGNYIAKNSANQRACFKHQIQTRSKKATIYIETLPNWDPKNEPTNPESVPGYYPGTFGSRFFGGVGGSEIRIHGRKMDRTWTLLRSAFKMVYL